MSSITNYIAANKEWLFPVIGLLAAALTWLLKLRHRKSAPSPGSPSSPTAHPQPVVVNNNFGATAGASSNPPIQPPPTDSVKERTTILFIDDDTTFKIVSMLRKAGWKRISIIKDIDRLDSEKLKQADIVFVDIQGVGKQLEFNREGLGLMKAIKERYPEKKVIIYSAVQLHDIFAEGIDYADARLRKSAEFIEFEKTIEDLLQ